MKNKKSKNPYNMGGNIGSLLGSTLTPAIGPLAPILGQLLGSNVSNFVQSMEKPRPQIQPHGFNTNVFENGGDLLGTYIFSDKLGTAKRAKQIAKKLNLPSDFIVEYKGEKHSGPDGGIPINKNLKPTNKEDQTNLSSSESGKSIATVEGGEVRINQKYKNGIGLNDISYNSAKKAFGDLIKENESLKQEFGNGGNINNYQLGGTLPPLVPQPTGLNNSLTLDIDYPNLPSDTGFIPQYKNPYPFGTIPDTVPKNIAPLPPNLLSQPVTPPQANNIKINNENIIDNKVGNNIPMLSNEQKAGIAGISLDFLSQSGPLLRGVEREQIQNNPNRGKIESLYRNRNFNIQPIINRENNLLSSLRQRIDNSTSSDAVRRNNLQVAYNNSAQRLSEAEMKGQQINNQYRAQEGNMLFRTGNEARQEAIRQQNANSQNQAAYDQGVRTLGKSLGNLGQAFLNSDAQRKTINSMLENLNQLYPNFNIRDNYTEYMKKYQALKSRGLTDEQIKKVFENDNRVGKQAIKFQDTNG